MKLSLKVAYDSFILFKLLLKTPECLFCHLVIRILVLLFRIRSWIRFECYLGNLLRLRLFSALVMLLSFRGIRLVLIFLLCLAPQFVQTLVFEVYLVYAEILVDFFLQTIVVIFFGVFKVLTFVDLPVA